MTSATAGSTVLRTEPLRTAAWHDTCDVPGAAPSDPVDVVLGRMRGPRFTSAAVVAAWVNDQLVGLVTHERRIAAASAATVCDVNGIDHLCPAGGPKVPTRAGTSARGSVPRFY